MSPQPSPTPTLVNGRDPKEKKLGFMARLAKRAKDATDKPGYKPDFVVGGPVYKNAPANTGRHYVVGGSTYKGLPNNTGANYQVGGPRVDPAVTHAAQAKGPFVVGGPRYVYKDQALVSSWPVQNATARATSTRTRR